MILKKEHQKVQLDFEVGQADLVRIFFLGRVNGVGHESFDEPFEVGVDVAQGKGRRFQV